MQNTFFPVRDRLFRTDYMQKPQKKDIEGQHYLNTGIITFDPRVHRIFLIPMKTYHTLRNIYLGHSVCHKAKELFNRRVLADPIHVFWSDMDRTERDKQKKDTKYKRSEIELWLESLKPQFGKMFDLYYAEGFAGGKMLFDANNDTYPKFTWIDPTCVRYFCLQNIQTQEVQLFCQWKKYSDHLRPNQIDSDMIMKQHNVPLDIRTLQTKLAGYIQKEIPFDPEVIFYEPFRPRLVRDRIPEYLRYTFERFNSSVNYKSRTDLNLSEFQTCFTSPWAMILPEYITYHRVKEPDLRTGESRIDTTRYVENKIDKVDDFKELWMRDPYTIDHSGRQSIHSIFKSYNNPKVVYEQSAKKMQSDSWTGLFEYENEDVMVQEEQSVTSTTSTLAGTVDSTHTQTGSYLEDKTKRIAQDYLNMQTLSRGVFEDPLIDHNGIRTVVGGPSHRFVFPPEPSLRGDIVIHDQEWDNKVTTLMTLPQSIYRKDRTAVLENDLSEKEQEDKRTREIAQTIEEFAGKLITRALSYQRNGMIAQMGIHLKQEIIQNRIPEKKTKKDKSNSNEGEHTTSTNDTTDKQSSDTTENIKKDDVIIDENGLFQLPSTMYQDFQQAEDDDDDGGINGNRSESSSSRAKMRSTPKQRFNESEYFKGKSDTGMNIYKLMSDLTYELDERETFEYRRAMEEFENSLGMDVEFTISSDLDTGTLMKLLSTPIPDSMKLQVYKKLSEKLGFELDMEYESTLMKQQQQQQQQHIDSNANNIDEGTETNGKDDTITPKKNLKSKSNPNAIDTKSSKSNTSKSQSSQKRKGHQIKSSGTNEEEEDTEEEEEEDKSTTTTRKKKKDEHTSSSSDNKEESPKKKKKKQSEKK